MLRALTQIRQFDYDDGAGLTFTLKIYLIGAPDPNQLADNVVTGDIGALPTDAASVVNTRIAAFVKDYCTATWGTVWQLGDTVRIIAAVDSIL
jgi:hypothetical protein